MNSDLSDCGVVVDVRQAGLRDSDLIYSDFQAKSRVHREWPVDRQANRRLEQCGLV